MDQIEKMARRVRVLLDAPGFDIWSAIDQTMKEERIPQEEKCDVAVEIRNFQFRPARRQPPARHNRFFRTFAEASLPTGDRD